MDVVGHDHILTNRCTARLGFFGMFAECGVNGIVGEDVYTIGGTEGYEINRRGVGLEDLRQAAGFVRMIAHAQSII